MASVVSVQLADLPLRQALAVLRKAPEPGAVSGLRHANVGAAFPLSRSLVTRPGLRRVGLLTFWDDAGALEGFLSDHPLAARFAGGWQATLEPLRAHGGWPGLPESLSRSRHTDYDGPAVVLTLGWLRLRHLLRFLRTSTPAEAAALDAPGFRWGTAMARPPFVATCSLWESTAALSAYAYGDEAAGHPSAIGEDRRKPFHLQSAFVRFRPLSMQGSLQGKNPLAEGALAR